jgi:hypothetical protein
MKHTQFQSHYVEIAHTVTGFSASIQSSHVPHKRPAMCAHRSFRLRWDDGNVLYEKP